MYYVEILQTNGDQKGRFHQGMSHSMPEVGMSFDIEFECPVEQTTMILQTSTVLEAEFHRDHVFVKTVNSAYLLKILATPAESEVYTGAVA